MLSNWIGQISSVNLTYSFFKSIRGRDNNKKEKKNTW